MNKRFIIFLLIATSVLLLGVVLYWTLSPLFQKETEVVPTNQVPPGQTQPTNPGTQKTNPSQPTPPPVGSPADQERQAQEALKRQGLDFAARQGTYSNANGFVTMRSVYTEVTSDLQLFLENQRKTLASQHPLANGSWSQTMRSVASSIVSAQPILGKNTAQVSVQVQQIINEQAQPQNVSYRELTITFVKQGTAWLASKIESKPFTP